MTEKQREQTKLTGVPFQKEEEYKAPEQKRGVTVLYGIHRLFDLATGGKSVKELRQALRSALNIEDEASAVVNGKEVEESYILNSDDTLEFVRLAGSKGGLFDLTKRKGADQQLFTC